MPPDLDAAAPDARLPTSVRSDVLGAGETRLRSRVSNDREGRRAALIVIRSQALSSRAERRGRVGSWSQAGSTTGIARARFRPGPQAWADLAAGLPARPGAATAA